MCSSVSEYLDSSAVKESMESTFFSPVVTIKKALQSYIHIVKCTPSLESLKQIHWSPTEIMKMVVIQLYFTPTHAPKYSSTNVNNKKRVITFVDAPQSRVGAHVLKVTHIHGIHLYDVPVLRSEGSGQESEAQQSADPGCDHQRAESHLHPPAGEDHFTRKTVTGLTRA